jgi:hypothetical protein
MEITTSRNQLEVHNKELLAIMDALKLWGCYLEAALGTVMVYSDYQNLEYFMTTKVLNRRQVRWAPELAAFDFKIVYRPSSQNGKPDTLLGRSEDQPITTILSRKDFLTK